MEYEFPFSVPTDLSAATDDELAALLTSVRDHAATFSGITPSRDVIDALTACRDLARGVTETMSVRAETRSLAADIGTITTPPPAPVPAVVDDTTPDEGDPVTDEGDPVTASARTRNPTVRDIAARRTGTPDLPENILRSTVTMHAAADVPGRFSTGQELTGFSDVVRALSYQVDRFPRVRDSEAAIVRKHANLDTLVIAEDGTARFEMRQFTRHGGVEFRRQFPKDLTVREGSDGYPIAQFAASERRLPGGSLLESFKQSVKGGRAITAAAGWCAPSEPIYDLCELSSLDGILDAPELQTERGGWQIPTGGGPNFATVWSGIGNSGTTHLTEAQVIGESPSKYCYDIPCPGFTDVRLGVDYFCLTGSLLQRRGYPEVVQWFSRQAMNALPHKINMGFIAAIVAASGAATVIPADSTCDDAISGLLGAVDLAIADAKYRNRMTFNGTLEVVLPMWVLVQLRAAGTRRTGVDMVGITDAQIVEWFAIRKAVPRFVYDWQDSFSGLPAGPGGAVPLSALPLTVDFLVYPAGTWVKAVQPVVSLDTVYDSTKLTTNEYTAMFVEDGWAALQMCPLSRYYTAPVDPGCLCVCSHS
jgi:hypothetical protein